MTTLAEMPAQIIAGDSLALGLDIAADYPAAAGWAVTLTLTPMAGGVPIVTIGTNGTDSWDIAVPSSTSALLTAGLHRYLIAATKALQRTTVAWGEVKVIADPAQNADQRSPAHRALDAIEAVLAGAASASAIKFVFEDGRSIENVPPSELIALRDHYARRVAAEKRGRRGPSRVLTRL